MASAEDFSKRVTAENLKTATNIIRQNNSPDNPIANPEALAKTFISACARQESDILKVFPGVKDPKKQAILKNMYSEVYAKLNTWEWHALAGENARREVALTKLMDTVDASRMTDVLRKREAWDNTPRLGEKAEFGWSQYFIQQYKSGNYDIREKIIADGKNAKPAKKYTEKQLAVIEANYHKVCDTLIVEDLSRKLRMEYHLGNNADMLARHIVEKQKRGESAFTQDDLGTKLGKYDFSPTIGSILWISRSKEGVYAEFSHEKARLWEIAGLYTQAPGDIPVLASMNEKKSQERQIAATRENQTNKDKLGLANSSERLKNGVQFSTDLNTPEGGKLKKNTIYKPTITGDTDVLLAEVEKTSDGKFKRVENWKSVRVSWSFLEENKSKFV